MGYQGAISELYDQLNSVASRTSLAEMLSNVWDNTTYSLYSNIAGNPAFYALWQVTDLIQGLTGGINIPFISAMGSGVDINTTVENLMSQKHEITHQQDFNSNVQESLYTKYRNFIEDFDKLSLENQKAIIQIVTQIAH